jgi:hypothetical protein
VNDLLTTFLKVNISPAAESQSVMNGDFDEKADSDSLELLGMGHGQRNRRRRRFRLSLPGFTGVKR